MKILSLLSVLTLSLASTGFAQNNQPNSTSQNKQFQDTTGTRGFWEGTFAGGNYLVALSRITSVSKHEYLLDKTLVVTEVNIDTLGSTTLRVYQITPAAKYGTLSTPGQVVERGKDLLDRAGQRTGVDLVNMVQKHHPTTTHAKTIEFRVKNLDTLTAMFDSAKTAWTSGSGRKFTVSE